MKRLSSLLGMLFVFMVGLTAHAALERVGPVGGVGSFPLWYQDKTGLTLELGEPINQAELLGGWLTILAANLPTGNAPEVFPNNYSIEHFYWSGVAKPAGNGVTKSKLILALEASFANGFTVRAGDQTTFARMRISVTPLPSSGTYKVFTPFKDYVFTNLVAGDKLFFTDDVGLTTPFAGALLTPMGPFLMPSATPGGVELPPTPFAGTGRLYVADPARIGPVTGSPLPPFVGSDGLTHNHNIFRVEGPNGFVDEETNFAVLGRFFNGTLAGNVTIDRASYTRSVNGLLVDVFATAFPAAATRLPASPILPPAAPVLSFFDAPPVIDPVTGALSAPLGLLATPMIGVGKTFWGQTQPIAVPLGVTVEDSSGAIPLYYGATVTDDVTITQAVFDPAGQTLTVKAQSSDSVGLPILTLVGYGDLVAGQIVIPLLAPPAYVDVLSAAGGLAETAVSTVAAGGVVIPGVTVPGAPSGAAALAGNSQAIVSFTAPAVDGGSPITSYSVTSTPGGKTAVGAASPLTVSGLINGTSYTFTVRASNIAGAGLASAPSNAVTPLGVPGIPTAVTAVAGNAQATVRFTAPAANGSPAITSYKVTSTPGGLIKTGTVSPIIVTGLTNGISYTFAVAATNINGTGLPSAASNAVTPASLPGAPTGVLAVPASTQATVSFNPPLSDGGSPISLYTVISTPGGISVTGSPSPLIVTGLTNGTSYTFTVSATNGLGTGPASAPSAAVRPATLPGAPTISSATPGIGQATIAFTAPANNGGSPITSYTVASNPGGLLVSGTASPLIVTGLTFGTVYNFTVVASNAIGSGPVSAPSLNITPTAVVPGAPTAVSAVRGDTLATVSFTPPVSNGGTPITSYSVTSVPAGGISAPSAASPIVVTGLTNGTAYRFTVKATNAIGSSVASVASAAVTPATVPNAPAKPTVTAGQRQVTVAFVAPANGGAAITSYTVTPFNTVTSTVGTPKTGTASPIIVTGLTFGVPYTFTVTATNSVGTGLSSPASNIIAPSAVLPGAPRTVTAVRGNTQATASFLPPLADGGSAITLYTVTSTPAGITATGAASPIVVSGLTNGVSYTFKVTATNGVGTGVASAASAAVTPATIPGAPTIGTAARVSASSASVAFTPPASNGGTAITLYTATASPGGITATRTASPITVIGLSPGTAYTFTVKATNAVGTGALSASSNQVPL